MTKSRSLRAATYCRLLVLIAVSFVVMPRIFAQAENNMTRARYIEYARQSAEGLDKNWLVKTNDSVTWEGINAWQRFPIADSLMEYMTLTGDRSLLPGVELAVLNKTGLDGNDDDLWAVISSLHLYQLHRSPQLLQFARTQFARLTETYWDDSCGGGIWWDHERTYKNAITNELLFYAATLLYTATGDRTYYQWSFKEWNWFNHSGLINRHYLINDGLDKHCVNNGQTAYTYNQGVILGALTNLYSMDRDESHITLATRIAKAVISDLSNSKGILVEPVADLAQDSQLFKGIFIDHLGHLLHFVKDRADRKSISKFILRNADAAWTHKDNPEVKINAYWDNNHVLYGAAAQSSGLSLFDAAALVTKVAH